MKLVLVVSSLKILLIWYKEREDQFGEIYELNPDDFPEEGVIVKAIYQSIVFWEKLLKK